MYHIACYYELNPDKVDTRIFLKVNTLTIYIQINNSMFVVWYRSMMMMMIRCDHSLVTITIKQTWDPSILLDDDNDYKKSEVI